jgi:uncharacterized protein DUF4160
MPTILRWKGFRFFFFSNEGDEPPHVHAEKEALPTPPASTVSLRSIFVISHGGSTMMVNRESRFFGG